AGRVFHQHEAAPIASLHEQQRGAGPGHRPKDHLAQLAEPLLAAIPAAITRRAKRRLRWCEREHQHPRSPPSFACISCARSCHCAYCRGQDDNNPHTTVWARGTGCTEVLVTPVCVCSWLRRYARGCVETPAMLRSTAASALPARHDRQRLGSDGERAYP